MKPIDDREERLQVRLDEGGILDPATAKALEDDPEFRALWEELQDTDEALRDAYAAERKWAAPVGLEGAVMDGVRHEEEPGNSGIPPWHGRPAHANEPWRNRRWVVSAGGLAVAAAASWLVATVALPPLLEGRHQALEVVERPDQQERAGTPAAALEFSLPAVHLSQAVRSQRDQLANHQAALADSAANFVEGTLRLLPPLPPESELPPTPTPGGRTS